MADEGDGPPLLDEHSIAIAGGTDDAWTALLDTVDGVLSRPGTSVFARVMGCVPSTASGPRPLAQGATIPGFRVVAADAPHELALAGRHRFSSYALTFRLDRHGADRCRLRAESCAEFPGLASRAYRLLVVGSGGHVLAVRRLLRTVRRRAEHATPGDG